MTRAKAFVLAVMPGVLAATVAVTPTAAQEEDSQTQFPAAAQHEAPQTLPPTAGVVGPGSLDRFLDETRTLRAEFSQELLDGGGNLIEEASGVFFLKRPNRFLWSYSEPFEQQVVADAENLWIHDVELEQVTVSPLAGAIASSPAMLLSGDGRFATGSRSWKLPRMGRLPGFPSRP